MDDLLLNTNLEKGWYSETDAKIFDFEEDDKYYFYLNKLTNYFNYVKKKAITNYFIIIIKIHFYYLYY